jgi:hypothetical protein
VSALVPPPIPLPLLVERLQPLTEALGSHPPEHQLNWMRGLGMWQLRALWHLAERSPLPLDLDDIAPADGAPVLCPGKNHLPIFSRFAKGFARVGDQVVGYNETGWEKWWVGPGHFVLRPSPDTAEELWVDYRQLPAETHPSFPALVSNDRLFGWPGPFSKLAYGGLVDRLRRVGGQLLIGRSTTTGLSLQAGAFFALWVPPRETEAPPPAVG